MKNVTVYRNGDIVCDGELTKNVKAVTPPNGDDVGTIEIYITDEITYKPGKHVPLPRQGAPKTWEREYAQLRRRIVGCAEVSAAVCTTLLDGLEAP